MRILIFSHGHPRFNKGGGEIAAYTLFQAINETEEHQAWFAARASDELLHWSAPISRVAEREYLIAGHAGVHDLTASIDLGDDSDFAVLLREIQPDIVHFHHYIWLGIEMIWAVRRICPQAKIVLTLHEFIAICMNNGQMIKTDQRLCHGYSPRECAQCFPDRTPEDFFLREQYIKRFFRLVDIFISPSEFLRTRYIDWGIPPEKIIVLENLLPQRDKLPPRPLKPDESRCCFGYFGQINPFKGLDILLEAFALLPPKIRKQVSLDIYASGLEFQEESYQKKIKKLLDKNKSIARYHGPYESEELGNLMMGIDWVMMGSIWWENSPVIIQEAFQHGRPLMVSAIGGMAEKVEDGVNGFCVQKGNPLAWARAIEKAASWTSEWENFYDKLPAYDTYAMRLKEHICIFQTLLL